MPNELSLRLQRIVDKQAELIRRQEKELRQLRQHVETTNDTDAAHGLTINAKSVLIQHDTGVGTPMLQKYVENADVDTQASILLMLLTLFAPFTITYETSPRYDTAEIMLASQRHVGKTFSIRFPLAYRDPSLFNFKP